MNKLSCTTTNMARTGSRGPSADSRHGQTIIWTLLLLALNLPLWQGEVATLFLFDMAAVLRGEVWRIITYPLVHLSFYHLLLDGAAFLLLWDGLEERGRGPRLIYLLFCGAGSLMLALALSPIARIHGLAGLSGIAHGLTAVTALELLQRHSRESFLFRTGLVLLAGIIGKSTVEMVTGRALFATLHLGEVGLPVAAAHGGGVLGGLVAFAVLHLTCGSSDQGKPQPRPPIPPSVRQLVSPFDRLVCRKMPGK